MFFFKITIIMFCLCISKVYANFDLVVVVSKDSEISNLSKQDVSKLFLSKIKSFPNGIKAIPIEINSKKLQEFFYKTVSNKNKKQLLRYWAKMIFTGRGVPAKQLKKYDDVIKFIKTNKNAITYIQRKYLDKNLKVILEFR